MLYSSLALSQRSSSLVPALVLAVASGCVGEREPPHSAATGRADASVPLAPSSDADDAGERDTGSSSPATDASADVLDGGVPAKTDAQVADAGKTQAPPPLVLKGARKCSADEATNELCSEGKRSGMCLDGYCVVEANCPRYCAAVAAREHADCVPAFDTKECQGVPECLTARKETIAICAKMRADIETGCLQATCANLRMLPPPQPS